MTLLIFINFLLLPFSLDKTFKDSQHFTIKNNDRNISVDSIPFWIRHLYEVNNDEFLNNAIPVVTFFKKLSDSTSYCIYEVDDGVCQITIVATQKNKKKYKSLKIGNECDEDFAFPLYSRTTYEHNTISNTILLTTDVEKAKQKYLIKDQNGQTRFRDGYSMENIETIHYSTKKIMLVNQSGNIITKDKKSR